MRFELFASCVVICLLTSGGHQAVRAAGLQSGALDNYGRAIKCVLALYPGVRIRALAVGVRGDNWHRLDSSIQELRALVLVIGQGIDPSAPGGEQPPILTVSFRFTEDHCIDRLDADGPLTETEKREAIERLVRDTPLITESRVDSAIREAGGRFGPSSGSEVRARMQDGLERLSSILDAPVIQQLHWSQDGMPIWDAVITGSCGGKRRTYNALVEPFHGNLIGLGEGP